MKAFVRAALAPLLMGTFASGASLRSMIPTKGAASEAMVVEDSSVSSMADALMNLLSSDSGNTPELAAFVATIKRLLENDMKPKVLANKEVQQAQVLRSHAKFATCRSTVNNALQPSGGIQAQVNDLSVATRQCRQQQAALAADSQAAGNQTKSMEAVKVAACNDFNSFQSSAPATCSRNAGENYRDYSVRLSSFFSSQVTAFDQKKKACDDATNAAAAAAAAAAAKATQLANQKAACDASQDKMDATSCQLFTTGNQACAANDACYDAAARDYASVMNAAKIQEVGLKTEWQAILGLQCLSDTFAVDDLKRGDAIAACRTADYSSELAKLSLNYPAVPAKAACSPPTGYAGTPQYVQANYAGLPALAPAKACVASCCSQAPVTTTTTTTTTTAGGKLMRVIMAKCVCGPETGATKSSGVGCGMAGMCDAGRPVSLIGFYGVPASFYASQNNCCSGASGQMLTCQYVSG